MDAPEIVPRSQFVLALTVPDIATIETHVPTIKGNGILSPSPSPR